MTVSFIQFFLKSTRNEWIAKLKTIPQSLANQSALKWPSILTGGMFYTLHENVNKHPYLALEDNSKLAQHGYQHLLRLETNKVCHLEGIKDFCKTILRMKWRIFHLIGDKGISRQRMRGNHRQKGLWITGDVPSTTLLCQWIFGHPRSKYHNFGL